MSASLNRGLFSWRNVISRKQIQTLLFKKLESRCSSGYRGANTPPTNCQVQSKQLHQTTIRNTSIQSSTAPIVSPDYIVRSPYEDREIPDVSFIEFMFSKMNGHAQESTAMINGITGQTYTFSELKESVIKVASALTKQGYKKGDVFCLFSPNLPEFSISFLAVSAIGGIVTTANPLYSEQELSRQLTHSTSVAIFTIPQMVDVVKKASADHPNIKEIIVFGEADGCRPFSTLTSDDGKAFPENVDIDSAGDILVLPYSSGTTGLPKGVMVSHRNVIANLIQTATSLPIYPSDCMLAVLPFFHIYGMVVIQFGAFYAGTPLTTLPKFDQTDFLKTIENYKVTLAPIVPPIAIFLSKHDLVSEYDLSSVRLWMCAAAPLGKTSQMEMAERLKTNNIIQGYGLTETSPVTHIDQVPPTLGTIGTCLCNTECKVIDLETGDLLGPGEEGEMCIRGPQVMMGYLNNPEATAGTIKDGWLHTGDICHYDENGYFTVADRLKELIKYKGFQVPPAELEALLLSHPHVDDAAVIGVPDDMAGELPKAFVTIHPHTTVTPEEIAQFVEEHVSPHKKLRGGVEIIEKIPKSASGKILRRELRDRSS